MKAKRIYQDHTRMFDRFNVKVKLLHDSHLHTKLFADIRSHPRL